MDFGEDKGTLCENKNQNRKHAIVSYHAAIGHVLTYLNVITSDHQQALYCMHAALDKSLIRSYGRGGNIRTL